MGGLSQSISLGEAGNSLCPVQTPHCLFHGLPGLWAVGRTPGNLSGLWSWEGLINKTFLHV